MELLQASQLPPGAKTLTTLDDDNLEQPFIRVAPDVDLDNLLSRINKLEQIYVEFPLAGDGRGFSIAKSLRLQGYKGRLIAVGHVTLDRLAYIKKVGFDAVVVSDNTNKTSLEQALKQISVSYQ